MKAISVSITEFTNEDFPGWVKCELIDFAGRRWIFEEKAPVVSAMALDAGSLYPCQGVIACEILGEEELGGKKAILADTSQPWGIESTDACHTFRVWSEQIICM